MPEPGHLLVRACLGLPLPRPPVWAMRQAGRWDPEFRKLRGSRSFYEFAADVDAAAQASLLPRRFGVDAIILFYDITTLPQMLGWPFAFEPGRGPVSRLVPRSPRDLSPLRQPVTHDLCERLLRVLAIVRCELREALPVIAFAGAPFTVACYCVGVGKDTAAAARYATEHPTVWQEMLELLADRTAEFLNVMSTGGADVLQLFDSWAGELDSDRYEQWAQRYHSRLFQRLAAPSILYVRECPYVDRMVASGCSAVSLGTRHDLRACRHRYPGQTFQGNVDAQLLANGTPEQVRQATLRCLSEGGGQRHIVNLNQGMPKDAKPENFQAFVDTVREWEGDETQD